MGWLTKHKTMFKKKKKTPVMLSIAKASAGFSKYSYETLDKKGQIPNKEFKKWKKTPSY